MEIVYLYPAVSIGPYIPTLEVYGIQHAIPSRSKRNSSNSLNGIGQGRKIIIVGNELIKEVAV
jgi:hypothetical protein